MSYFFTITAPTKQAAKARVIAKMAETVQYQPVHARDLPAVVLNASTAIDLLHDDPTKHISVTCNGYVSWAAGTGEDAEFSGVSVAVLANHFQPA